MYFCSLRKQNKLFFMLRIKADLELSKRTVSAAATGGQLWRAAEPCEGVGCS